MSGVQQRKVLYVHFQSSCSVKVPPKRNLNDLMEFSLSLYFMVGKEDLRPFWVWLIWGSSPAPSHGGGGTHPTRTWGPISAKPRQGMARVFLRAARISCKNVLVGLHTAFYWPCRNHCHLTYCDISCWGTFVCFWQCSRGLLLYCRFMD